MIRSVIVGVVCVCASLPAFPGGVSAQVGVGSATEALPPEYGPPAWEWGGEVVLAQPLGEFSDYVGDGTGFSLFGARYVDGARRLAIRLDIEVIGYGSRTVRVPLSPSIPLVDVDVTTDNAISSFALGPQVVMGGGAFRPYLRAAVGVSEFTTTTSVRSTDTGLPLALPFASTENFDDHTFLVTAAAGLRWGLSRESRHPVSLQLGGAITWHGMTSYLREGSITEGPNGETLIDPVRSETNLATLHLGVTVGAR